MKNALVLVRDVDGNWPEWALSLTENWLLDAGWDGLTRARLSAIDFLNDLLAESVK